MKRTLVIGNGFDLDAGMKTSYSDFARSKFWPFSEAKQYEGFDTLAYVLNENLNLNTWFDVEETMFNYARKDKVGLTLSGNTIQRRDEKSLDILKSKLLMYLRDQQDNLEPQKDSTAIKVLDKFLSEDGEKRIYSFNYTDLSWIAQRNDLYFGDKSLLSYMHGSVDLRHIILGVGEKRDLKDDYFFFYKISSPYYRYNRMIPDLQQSDEIIIFGHSLGVNDYPYFMPFFYQQSDFKRYFDTGRKKITIFTYSESSMLEIKRHLRDLTGNELTSLYNLSDFNILATDGSNDYEITQFFTMN